jgi:DeoR/GlpR family transcriptional regulator of sugar metabolism
VLRRTPRGRWEKILALLRTGSVSVQDVAKKLDVSEITIRRDLDVLKQQGKLLRVYGGAFPTGRVAYEFSFQEKESQNQQAKESIARAAARLVEPGSAVFLDTGTTALAVARALRAVNPGVIVTINLCVASEYVGQKEIKVLVLGGEVSSLSPDVYGAWTIETLSTVTVDVAFLGCDAVDPADGFYSADTRSAAVSRLMLSRSRRAYLMADHSKFGRRSMCRIAPLGKLKGVVTDAAPSAPHRKALKRLGVEVIMETP